MAHERYTEKDFEDYGRAYAAAIAEGGGEQPVQWMEITPAIADAYDYANERLGLDLAPQALPAPQEPRKEVANRRQRSGLHVSPWAAGALLIVAIAAGSEAYQHIGSNETQQSASTTDSQQSGAYNLADASNESLTDKCFNHPMNPNSGPLRTTKDGIVQVIADAKEIRVLAVETQVVVPRGIHVGVITVCGAVNTLNVEGSAQQAVMFGANTHMDVAEDATVDSGAVEGGNACASGNLNGQIYADRC